MVRKFVGSAALAAMVALMLNACSSSETPKTQTESTPQQSTQQTQTPSQMMPANPHTGAAVTTVAGIDWTVPAGWAAAGEKPMRVATYMIDPADPKAECVVYYFGEGQGGAVDANISRWINQVKQPDGSSSESKAKRGTVTSECCEIATVEVDGTYLFSAGPMMQTSEERPDYVLVAGIAPAPKGNVFFKMTGPKANSEKSMAQFMSLLKSVKKSTT